jgi:hypothetical protein
MDVMWLVTKLEATKKLISIISYRLLLPFFLRLTAQSNFLDTNISVVLEVQLM